VYTAGPHRGVYVNMHQRSNRSKQLEHARTALGVDVVGAGRIAFVAWLAENADPVGRPS
jgi:hypothetical protein